MSTPAAQFDFSSVARPAPSPTYDFSPVAREAPATPKRRRAPAAEPEAPKSDAEPSTWSLAAGAPKVKDWYRQTFNSELPVTSFGQDDYHVKLNLDHRNSFDVPLSPSSKEGQALVSYLTGEGIPFRAITAADVARGVKASGPHIHVGPESHAIGSSPAYDFSSVARDAPLDFSSVAREAPDTEEVVSINASRPTAPRPPDPRTLSPLDEREQFNAQTAEGRQGRDARELAEWGTNTKLTLDVPLPSGFQDWSEVTSEEASRQAARTFAASRNIPADFAEKWLDKNRHLNLHLYGSATGEKRQPADYIYEGSPFYDFERRTLRVSADMPHLKQLEQDYLHSKGAVEGLGELVSDDTYSPFEKVTALGRAVWDSPQSRETRNAVDTGAKTLSAADRYGWAKALGYGDQTATAFAGMAFEGMETPVDDPAGDLWRAGTDSAASYVESHEGRAPLDKALGGSISSQMRDSGRTGQAILGVVAQPTNLVPLPEVGALLKAGRLGRAVAEGGELTARVAKMLRPLGLEAAERTGGEALEVVMRGADGTHYLVDAGAREAVNLETGAAVELPRAASGADAAALNEARARHAYHSERAANASDASARANASVLAEDYAREVERLQQGVGEVAPEGFDVADAHASRFQQPAPDSPRAPLWKRAASNARAVVQLPKAKAGFDLSATGRQGLAQALAHPTYLKEAFAAQVKAFASEDLFNDFAQSIRNRPDFELMNESGLFLSCVGPEAEEAFASKLAQKIPGVRASDRAYSAALDSVRTQAWSNYVEAVAKNPNTTPETYKAIAELVNISTGRGVVPILDRSALGKKIINALNVPFFSPRNTASKFNLISPRRIVANMLDPATRPVAYLQLRDATRGLATLGTTLGLMHFAGLDAGLNPFSSDFGKVRVGKAVYDLTGEGYTVRYLAQMARTAVNETRGKKARKGASLTELTTRYLRTQLQPATGAAVDWWTGKTIEGKPVTSASAALDMITPFVVEDVIKGFQAEGWLGAVKATPGVLGVGVNFYDKTSGIRPRGAPASKDEGGTRNDEGSGPVSEAGGSDAYERRLSDVRGRVAADLGRGSAEASERTGGPVRARLAEGKARERAEREGVEWADFESMLHGLGVEVVP
jgi:hypothetical protein